MPSGRQRQRGVSRVDVGLPGRPVGQPAHRHRAEHGGQPPFVAAFDPAPPRGAPLVPAGGQRLLLPQRAQVEMVLQQLPLKLAAPGLD